MLFGVRFCNVLYGLIWLSYGLNQIWLDDSLLKVICPQDFESGLLQDVVSMFFLAFADPVFGHVRVPKCDSCCDDGTGWGGWYQAGWSGVPASWGFEVVPCKTVFGSSQLQTASNCSCSYCSNCFKLLQSASNCFKMLQRMFRRAPFCEARGTLLQAARDGRLASAFKEMRKASVLQLCFMWVPGVTKTIW